jgi:hypothetical protein
MLSGVRVGVLIVTRCWFSHSSPQHRGVLIVPADMSAMLCKAGVMTNFQTGMLTVCARFTACRVLFSTDQSFPLAGAFAYSVYQFQSKRVKRDPEGPFFGGNAIVGAIFSTLCCLAIACGVSALLPDCGCLRAPCFAVLCVDQSHS